MTGEELAECMYRWGFDTGRDVRDGRRAPLAWRDASGRPIAWRSSGKAFPRGYRDGLER